MNVIYSQIKPGLSGWKKKGARIEFLKEADLKIPVIFLRSRKKTGKLFLIATGLHLEETSGPLFVLDSQKIFPSLSRFLESVNVVLFPIINQRGLLFDEKDKEENLRYDENEINYNSGWGGSSKKCLEVSLVEKYILDLFKKYDIKFVLSLHEDSTEPGKGYLWMNSIKKKQRTQIQNYLLGHIPADMLTKLRNVGLRKGFIENKFTIVNSRDDSFENFTSEILGVPTLLSEAPFGLDLSKRVFFHKTSLDSIPLNSGAG